MKKLFVVLVAVAFCFGATSCKKDCFCAWKGDGLTDEQKKEINVGQLSKSDCEGTLPAITIQGAEYKCESR